MKTIEIKIYSFSELSEDAKEKAINNYRNSDYDNFYAEELTDSVKAFLELFNIEIYNRYSHFKLSNIDASILELQGIRLYKWLINNYYSDLFKPKYIKSINREIYSRALICKVKTGHKGNKYTQIYSKLNVSNDCILTGVCYDNDILKPIYDFLSRPDKSTTYEDLMQDVENAVTKAYQDIEDWINSDEYIIENIESNDYEFTEDGKRY